jgi:hypothetical protein
MVKGEKPKKEYMLEEALAIFAAAVLFGSTPSPLSSQPTPRLTFALS